MGYSFPERHDHAVALYLALLPGHSGPTISPPLRHCDHVRLGYVPPSCRMALQRLHRSMFRPARALAPERPSCFMGSHLHSRLLLTSESPQWLRYHWVATSTLPSPADSPAPAPISRPPLPAIPCPSPSLPQREEGGAHQRSEPAPGQRTPDRLRAALTTLVCRSGPVVLFWLGGSE